MKHKIIKLVGNLSLISRDVSLTYEKNVPGQNVLSETQLVCLHLNFGYNLLHVDKYVFVIVMSKIFPKYLLYLTVFSIILNK